MTTVSLSIDKVKHTNLFSQQSKIVSVITQLKPQNEDHTKHKAIAFKGKDGPNTQGEGTCTPLKFWVFEENVIFHVAMGASKESWTGCVV